jgi:nucleotide-binding universal stress UspA family protein
MKNTELLHKPQNKISPFTITQALVGLESAVSDNSLLQYFDFFTKKISTTSAFFIHVERELNQFPELYYGGLPDSEVKFLEEETTKEFENRIEEYFKGDENLYTGTSFRIGNPLKVLLATAEEMQADLVVIGQKKGAKNHGILAKKLARKAKGNALVIPENSKTKMKIILVPIDFSENSARALQTAVGIKKRLGDSVRLIALNVFQLPNMSRYKISKSPSQFKSYVQENVKEAFENFLEKYIPADKGEVEAQLLFKDSPKMAGHIYSFAADHQVDFMIIGATGHTRLERLLMGSVTEKMLNLNQSFPTLVVK